MAHSDRVEQTGGLSACAFWSFALGVILLPIGLGGARPVPLGLAQAGLAVCCLCLAFDPERPRGTPFFTRLKWALGLLTAVLLWAIFQIQPYIVPTHWAHPLWRETAATLGQSVAASISIAPEDALKGLTHLATYITCGIAAYILGQESRRAQRLTALFWIIGSVICLYGLIIQITGSEQILWFKKWAYKTDLTATFVNHNHFAIYAGMVMTVGLALMMQSWRATMRGCKSHQRVAAIRNWLLYQGMPRAAVLILAFIGIVLSHSRAGLVWSLIGCGAYIFFYQIYVRSWGRAILFGLIAALGFAATVGVEMQVSDHFDVLFGDYSAQARSQVYQLTWHAILDNPWLGYGLNGFEPEFRLYQHNMFEVFNHAHSDLLESLLDLGMVAGLMLWTAVALLLTGLWHGIRHRRHDGIFPTLALALSIMVLGHAGVDFDLQIPGIAIIWAAFLGTGLAQSWQRAEKKAEL